MLTTSKGIRRSILCFFGLIMAACGPGGAPGNGNGEPPNGNNGPNGEEPEETFEDRLARLPEEVPSGFNPTDHVFLDEHRLVAALGVAPASDDIPEWGLLLYDTTDQLETHIVDIAIFPGAQTRLTRFDDRVVAVTREPSGEIVVRTFEIRDGEIQLARVLDPPLPPGDDASNLWQVVTNHRRIVALFTFEWIEFTIDDQGQPSVAQRVTKPYGLGARYAYVTDDDILLEARDDVYLWSLGDSAIGEDSALLSSLEDVGSYGSVGTDGRTARDPRTGLFYLAGVCEPDGAWRPIRVLDISDPEQPTITDVDPCRELYAEGQRGGSGHRFAFVDDRAFMTWHGTHPPVVLEVQDGPNLQPLGFVDPLGTNPPYAWIHAVGDRLYFTWSTNTRRDTWVPISWVHVSELELMPLP